MHAGAPDRAVGWELSWFAKDGGAMLGNVTIEGLSLKEMSDAVSAALRRAGSPTTTSDHIGIGEMAVDAPLAAVLQPHVTPEIRLEDYDDFLGFTRREPSSRG